MARKKENKRSDGYYEVKAAVGRNIDGKTIYKSFYSTKSKSDARLKAEKYKSELETQQHRYDSVTFKDYSAEFLVRIKEQVKETTFRNTYVSCVRKHLNPYFGHLCLHTIRKSDIENYITYTQKSCALSTVKNHVRVLHSIFADAIDNQIIETNPCSRLKYKSEMKSEKRVYTPEQAEMVLDYCSYDEYGLPVHLLLSYGMSRSELLAVTIDDIDFTDLTISISKAAVTNGSRMIIDQPKNKYRNRKIAISQETADWLRECQFRYICNPYSDDILPVHQFGKLYKGFMRRMHNYYLSQGVDVPMLNPHELRHTRATLWVNSGKNLFAIAEMLGWSDLSMLRKVYGHADIQELRKTLEI